MRFTGRRTVRPVQVLIPGNFAEKRKYRRRLHQHRSVLFHLSFFLLLTSFFFSCELAEQLWTALDVFAPHSQERTRRRNTRSRKIGVSKALVRTSLATSETTCSNATADARCKQRLSHSTNSTKVSVATADTSEVRYPPGCTTCTRNLHSVVVYSSTQRAVWFRLV